MYSWVIHDARAYAVALVVADFALVDSVSSGVYRREQGCGEARIG